MLLKGFGAINGPHAMIYYVHKIYLVVNKVSLIYCNLFIIYLI